MIGQLGGVPTRPPRDSIAVCHGWLAKRARPPGTIIVHPQPIPSPQHAPAATLRHGRATAFVFSTHDASSAKDAAHKQWQDNTPPLPPSQQAKPPGIAGLSEAGQRPHSPAAAGCAFPLGRVNNAVAASSRRLESPRERSPRPSLHRPRHSTQRESRPHACTDHEPPRAASCTLCHTPPDTHTHRHTHAQAWCRRSPPPPLTCPAAPALL